MEELLSEKLMHIVEIICFLENRISGLQEKWNNTVWIQKGVMEKDRKYDFKIPLL